VAINKALTGFAFGVLNEFLSIMHEDGFARPSRFEVVLLPPSKITNLGMDNVARFQLDDFAADGTTRHASLKCSEINMPGRVMNMTTDDNHFGPARQVVDGVTFGDITAKFTMLSVDGKEKQYFEAWQGMAWNIDDWSVGYYDEYVGEIKIYLLNEKGERKYGCHLFEVYPKTVGDISLNSGTSDIVDLDVTFSYRYWGLLEGESTIPQRITQGLFDLLGNTVERKLIARLPKVLKL
tara:strand:+ start:464 stop:1174 length:711 start_codon:yes stop_codon:yes gene_type:complete